MEASMRYGPKVTRDEKIAAIRPAIEKLEKSGTAQLTLEVIARTAARTLKIDVDTMYNFMVNRLEPHEKETLKLSKYTR